MLITRRVTGSVLLTALIAVVATTALAQQAQPVPNPEGPIAARIDGARANAKGISQAQIDNVAARIAAATGLVNRLERDAKASGRSEGWRQATLESLLGLSLAQLERVEREAYSADALAASVASVAMEDPQIFGDTTQDLVYFPITPCRFVDTRAVGGPISGIRGYDIVLSGASYGGSGACNPTVQFGVSENAFGALAMNVTIVDPASGPGFLAVKPTAAAPVTSLLNWYNSGPGVQVANAGIVTMDQSGAADEFVVQTSNPTQVIIDIFGAFLAPHATALDINVLSTITSVAANATYTIQSPDCPAGYRLTGGGHTAGFFGSPATLTSSRPNILGVNNATRWVCQGTNTATVQNYECYVVCTRVPGR